MRNQVFALLSHSEDSV